MALTKTAQNSKSTSNTDLPQTPSITLPKGGGAIRGIDEKFTANTATGTASLTIPLFTTPSRSDFYPKLSLSYDSGAGNAIFGLGWSLSVPSITRKTDKGLPRYLDAEDSDTFILSGAEDLVPALQNTGTEWTSDNFKATLDGEAYLVQRYRPRIEGLYARIERWKKIDTGELHWQSVSKDNVKSIYGLDANSRIADPTEVTHIFSWLLAESRDDKGNVIRYEYKPENGDNVDASLPQEKNRLANGTAFTNCYLKRIQYGNKTPNSTDWLFQVVFDYGEHDAVNPDIDETHVWKARPDAFSSYRAGFEIRTWRLCQRVLMFHHFAELGDSATLVRSTDFAYNDADPAQSPVACYLTSVTQTGYVRENEAGDYQKKSFPPLEFTYTPRLIEQEIHFADAETLENLPIGLDGIQYAWLDLEGEGVSGILTQQADAWFYKRNLGGARFSPTQFVTNKPSVAKVQTGQQQFMDLAGDGQMDLVQFAPPLAGFYERGPGEQWEPFTAFRFSPNVDWHDPNLRFIDLTGDGHADILLSEQECFVWYASRAEEGFGPAEFVNKLGDEELGPLLVFADSTQSVYLADMSGDGLSDIVRIKNGEVCYWSNLGYGRFGAKVMMDGAPLFDYPEYFDPARIRLADIDGSGTTDIIYLGRETVTLWFNQAGNRWSKAQHLANFPATDNLSSVTVVDLLGNGTACIVWSTALPSANGHPVQYIDLMGGLKPHLLSSIKNNLGEETRLQYAASTKFYLQDVAEGKRWITKLPFPVHVVERVEAFDHVSKTKLETLYGYHHGYYDGPEREFRGFGLVEQWDTETLSKFAGMGLFSETPSVHGEEFHLPPVHTKTWFHHGAFIAQDNISKQLVQEYYGGDLDARPWEDTQAVFLPDTLIPDGLTADEAREACRALKGSILRQEIFADDDSANSRHPYNASEHTYHVRLVQPMQGNEHAVFSVSDAETVVCDYERDPDDPRISHQMTLEVDDFGNVTKGASIAYARRAPSNNEPPHPEEQTRTLITYTESQFFNLADEPVWYRIGVPISSRTYEVTGVLAQAGIPFLLDAVWDALETTADIPYEATADLNTPHRRQIEHVRSLYLKNDLSGPLPLTEVESLALPYESYKQAFSQGMITKIYGERVNDNLLKEDGKYVKSSDYKAAGLFPAADKQDDWWMPSGRSVYDIASAPGHFYLPDGFQDPFGNIAFVEYDAYDLLVTRMEDPLHNTVEAQINYRIMLPDQIVDANANRSAIAVDALGMVTVTAVIGKDGQNQGDSLEDPTTRFEYELLNWKDHHQPVYVHTLSREQHGSANPRWQETYTYSDGTGREVIKKIQAEPGMAPARDADGALVHDADGKLVFTFTNSRWVGTGRTMFDNKGNAIKKYEPFFDSTPEFEDEQELVEWGVTPILRYDPLSRLIRTDLPNGTFSKVEFDAWQQTSWDENDTVIESEWFQKLLPNFDPDLPPPNPSAEQEAALKAFHHASTPTTAHLDVLGRAFLSIADNGPKGKYATRNELDIEGNRRSITDALGRKVMHYDYDMLGTQIHHDSVDAGERWTCNDSAGKPLRAWDSRDHTFRTVYDELQRATHLFVQRGFEQEVLLARTLYGEAHLAADTLNLRARIYQHYDGAGVVTYEGFDFKGNQLNSRRQLALEYKGQVDWSALANLSDLAEIQSAASSLLETETFTTHTDYDALNRPIRLTTPDASVIRPTYNEANFLETLDVRLRGAPTWTPFVIDIDYNAKGQRELIEYGNGTRTNYTYDAKTFRLTSLKTLRAADNANLQDLSYVYDPVGNITRIADQSQQTIFFDNQVVTPTAEYVYDAIYRLSQSNGREHIGQVGEPEPPTWNDGARSRLPHPGDGQAMRNYSEAYEYDAVGNILQLSHAATNGSWTRTFTYDEPNAPPKNNRLTHTTIGSESDTYDYDAHGNMTHMSHLPHIDWDFKDQLQSIGLGGGGTSFYVYDSAGRRVRKVIERQNGTRKEERIYLGGFEIYRVYNGNGNTVTLERETLHIADDTRRVALVETKTLDVDAPPNTLPGTLMRYQYTNHLDSAGLELDESGAVISYEEYYPYGSTSYQAVRSSTEVSPKRYRYTGKERDEETGLYYHGARYYAPWLGRWTAADPAGVADGVNLYTYTRGNPISLADPSGTQSVDPRVRQALAEYRALEKSYKEHQQALLSAEKAWTAEAERLRDAPPLDAAGRPLEQGGYPLWWAAEDAAKKHAAALASLEQQWQDVQAKYNAFAYPEGSYAQGSGLVPGLTQEQRFAQFNAAANSLKRAAATGVVAAAYGVYTEIKNRSTGPMTPDQLATMYKIVAVGSGLEAVSIGVASGVAGFKMRKGTTEAPINSRKDPLQVNTGQGKTACVNCGYTSTAVVEGRGSTSSGVAARTGRTEGFLPASAEVKALQGELGLQTGKTHSAANITNLVQLLKVSPPGTNFTVTYMNPGGGTGHVIAAIVGKGGELVFLETQVGKVHIIPGPVAGATNIEFWSVTPAKR